MTRTATHKDEERTWRAVAPLLREGPQPLAARVHRAFVARCLDTGLPRGFTALDTSRPWLLYWSLRSLAWLDSLEGTQPAAVLDDALAMRVRTTILACWNEDEGCFAGAPGLVPHTASMFAALSALALLRDDLSTYSARVVRCVRALYTPLPLYAQPAHGVPAGFAVHRDGEVDVRGTYCAVASAALSGGLHTLFASDDGAAVWTAVLGLALGAQCPMDGGFGAVPGAEAHAGYTYCALALLALLVRARPDLAAAASERIAAALTPAAAFAAALQCPRSGGMRGRSNKLIDACYSFWAAAVPRLAADIAAAIGAPVEGLPRVDAHALAQFITRCCQNAATGGLRDKPGKGEDLYHTCYALSGLALCGALPQGYDAALNIVPF